MQAAPSYNLRVNARLLSLVLLASQSLWACGAGSQAARAESGLHSYLVALRGDDPRPVYEMLPREQRETLDFAEWSRQWQESQAEREQQAQELEESLKTQGVLEEQAKVRFADGKVVTLRRLGKGWTLDQPLVARTQAETPQDALNVFSAAIEERALHSLLGILSQERRAAIELRLSALRASLATQANDNWRALYKLSETRAELIWHHEDVRYKVTLVNEDGNWLVDDLHLGPDPVVEEENEKETPEPAPAPSIRRF